MGLRYIKGLSESRDWTRIDAARRDRPFVSVDDVVARTGLDERVLSRLAEAGALEAVQNQGGRRNALWQVRGLARTPTTALLGDPVSDDTPEFDELNLRECVAWDYRSSAHSTRAHPLATLREALSACRLPDAKTIGQMRDGCKVNYAGLVICRQRPGTAAGVVFMTLEDETGFVNLVIWETVFDKYALIAKTTSFLGVTGKIQRADGVVHLVVEALWRPQLETDSDPVPSRNFH